MHLKNQMYIFFMPFRFNVLINLFHGNLDDIGLSTLHWSIHSHPFGLRAYVRQGRIKSSEISSSAKKGLGISFSSGFNFNFVQIRSQTSEGLKIFIIEIFGLLAVNSEIGFKSINPHTIENAEINGLSPGAHTFINLPRGNSENTHSNTRMHIFFIFKYLYKFFILRENGGKAQFNLGVIKRDQLESFFCHKSMADGSA